MSDDRVCEECGRWVERNELLYRVRIEVFAEPTVQLPEATTKEKAAEDWDALIRRMEEMSDDQVREAEDQVYEMLEYNLCRECRKDLHARIRRRRDLKDEESATDGGGGEKPEG